MSELVEMPAELVERLASRGSDEAAELTAEAQAGFANAAQQLTIAERVELTLEAQRAVERVRRALAELPSDEGNGRGDKFHGHAQTLGEFVGAGVLGLDEARGVLTDGAVPLCFGAGHHVWRSIERGLAKGAASPIEPEMADFGRAESPVIEDGGRAAEPAEIKGRLASQLLAETPEVPDWLVPGVVARGWTVKVAAREKTGKGTLIFHLMGSLERGESTVFGPAPAAAITSVIYTEEPADSIREKIAHARMDRSRIIYGWELAGQEWKAKANYLVWAARQEGHALLFIDNVSRATGVEEEAGVELARAVEYLSEQAKAADLTVIVDHHHRKAAGKLEDKSRGGTALSGAVENNIEIERVGDWQSRVRKLSSRGRVSATIWERTIALSQDSTGYETVATAEQPQTSRERSRLHVLAGFGSDGVTVTRYAEAIDLGRSAAQDALRALSEKGWAKASDDRPQLWSVAGEGLGNEAEEPPV